MGILQTIGGEKICNFTHALVHRFDGHIGSLFVCIGLHRIPFGSFAICKADKNIFTIPRLSH